MRFRESILTLIKSLTGQANILTIPVEFIHYTGSLHCALFLSQLLYWSDKGIRKDGFIWKTYKDWKREIQLSEHQVRKAAKQLSEMGVLETKVMKADGNPTVHYHLIVDMFSDSFLEFLQNKAANNSSIEAGESSETLTETTTETTTEITDKKEYKEPKVPSASSLDSSSQDSENLSPKEESLLGYKVDSTSAIPFDGGSVSKSGPNSSAGENPFIVSDPEPFGQVFSDWCEVMEQIDAVANKKRRAAVCSRLKEGYSVDDLKLATRGILFSKWHMGQNEAKAVYDDLALICKDGVQVEKFRQLARANGVKPSDQKRKSDVVRSSSSSQSEGRQLRWTIRYGNTKEGYYWKYPDGRTEDLTDEEGRAIEAGLKVEAVQGVSVYGGAKAASGSTIIEADRI